MYIDEKNTLTIKYRHFDSMYHCHNHIVLIDTF